MGRRAGHLAACEKEHGELSITPKECGICMENVYDKPDARFGLMSTPGADVGWRRATAGSDARTPFSLDCLISACEHCFCLECIRKWRTQGSVNTEASHGCPFCRTITYFVVPSAQWLESGDEKTAVVQAYKEKLRCASVMRALSSNCTLSVLELNVASPGRWIGCAHSAASTVNTTTTARAPARSARRAFTPTSTATAAAKRYERRGRISAAVDKRRGQMSAGAR